MDSKCALHCWELRERGREGDDDDDDDTACDCKKVCFFFARPTAGLEGTGRSPLNPLQAIDVILQKQ